MAGFIFNVLHKNTSLQKQSCGARFAKLMIKDKLKMALIESESINLINNTLYKHPAEPSQIIICNKNMIAANSGNNGKTSVKGQQHSVFKFRNLHLKY